MYCSDENLSDDEIFFGKLTLKEVKKHIFLNSQRHTISFVFICLLRLFVLSYITIIIVRFKNRLITILPRLRCSTESNEILSDESVSVIETHSEPDIYTVKDTIASLDYSNANFSPRAPSDWDVKSTDDSFLKLEEMVSEMCTSPKKKNREELDNTLEVVEFILNNAHTSENDSNAGVTTNKNKTDANICEGNKSASKNTDTVAVKKETVQHTNESDKCKSAIQLQIERLYESPLKNPNLKNKTQNIKSEVLSTPSTETRHVKDVFKTPKNPSSSQKYNLGSIKRTPGKNNAYKHITSPVASYIKNCPQVPLLTDVHPKKPLPGSSSIPKFIKTTSDKKVCNKENVLLPSIAYKSAKTTKVITIPDKEKLPQSPWAKKIASSLPKPVVIKHDHREVTSVKTAVLPHHEDSFANLSLHQADLSVCTQKSAAKLN